MVDMYYFAAVEFVDDPNVVGLTYWYLCDFEEVAVGDIVTAPLGRHNHLQDGVVRKTLHATEFDAPFPFYLIKRVKGYKKVLDNVQNNN